MIKKDKVKKIFIATLTNVGDIILTLAAIELVKREFPRARLSILAGPEGREIFASDTQVEDIIVFDKYASLKDKIKLAIQLRKQRFDMVIDFRNTLWPYILGARYFNLPFAPKACGIQHKVLEHLHKLKFLNIAGQEIAAKIYTSAENEKKVEALIHAHGLNNKKIIAVCPGSKSAMKKWAESGFAFVLDCLNALDNVTIVMLGTDSDKQTILNILKLMKTEALNFCGKTSIRELAAFLKQSRLLITCDSAPMHIGWAVGVPIVALFGPTDPKVYAPITGRNFVITANVPCAPCDGVNCRNNDRCMKEIDKNFVVGTAKRILTDAV